MNNKPSTPEEEGSPVAEATQAPEESKRSRDASPAPSHDSHDHSSIEDEITLSPKK